ncbi:MAG: hypothetical protein OSJ52_05375 [Lachnospiraceae bacterium]|nr:hypothetical protein [Lachnospiraceae bacterium]
MKRLVGFILFWIAVGMFIMFCLSRSILIFGIILLLLGIGYNLFCSG